MKWKLNSVPSYFIQHKRCLCSSDCRYFFHINQYFVGDWLVLFRCMVGVILSTDPYELPSKKRDWTELWFCFIEYRRFHVIRHFQHRPILQSIHSGALQFWICTFDAFIFQRIKSTVEINFRRNIFVDFHVVRIPFNSMTSFLQFMQWLQQPSPSSSASFTKFVVCDENSMSIQKSKIVFHIHFTLSIF